ncbi:MAG TPA: cyclic nucleotide-binding domain-containing protein [Thermodesulfobacteriota bacterium]|nr:cyclic nucleotide-binding domain-containing protein [Thermodesulfobacteriota bacterium]
MIDPKTLTGIPFFADLNDRELEEVAKILKKKTYKPGDVIFTETRDGESLYILRKGEVKACKTAPDGQLFTLTVMKDGDIFGEMSFLDGRPRSATVVAITDIEIFLMERKDFEGLVEKEPWVVYKLMRNIVYTIHAIVRGMNTRYMDMLNYMWGRKRG